MATDYFPFDVHNAISRSIIVIDEMHLNIKIRDYTSTIKKQNNFVGYFLAVLTTSLALLTSNFSDALGICAEYWKNIFFIADGALGICSICSLKKFIAHKEMTPEELITSIKEKKLSTTISPGIAQSIKFYTSS